MLIQPYELQSPLSGAHERRRNGGEVRRTESAIKLFERLGYDCIHAPVGDNPLPKPMRGEARAELVPVRRAGRIIAPMLLNE